MKYFYKALTLIIAVSMGSFSSIAQCVDVTVSIFSMTSENGPTNVEWQVRNFDNVNLFTGNATFNNETNSYEAVVCLEPGCYNLRVVGNGVSNPQTFYAQLFEGQNELAPTSSNNWGIQVIELDFCTGIFTGECNANFNYSNPEEIAGFYSFNNESTASSNNVEYTWTFGDDTSSDNPNPNHQYAMNGLYEVCLHQMQFMEGVLVCESTYCQEILVDAFNNEFCPTTMYASGECANWVFEVANAQPNENVIWYFGETVVDNAGHYIEHTFTQSGVYDVCAYFTSELCPEGAEVCQEIAVDICETTNCSIEIEVVNLGNGLYEFTAYGNPEVYPMMWNFGDGTTLAATWVVQHQYEEVGQYEICGSVNSELCSEMVIGCVGINYEGNQECTTVNFSIDSFVEDGGATFFEYDFVNLDTEEMEATGVAQFSTFDPYFDQILCLNNGCYSLRICTSNEFFNWEAVSVLFSEQFDVIGWLPYCNGIGREYLVSLNSKCTWEEEPCTNYEVEVAISGDYMGQLSDALTIVLGQDLPVFVEDIILSNENGFSASACIPSGCYEISIESPVAFNGNISAYITVNGDVVLNETVPPAVLSSVELEFGVGVDCSQSIHESEMLDVEVYPNPARSNFNVVPALNEQYSINLYDMTGRLVYSANNLFGPQEVAVSSMSSGVYSLQLIQQGKVSNTLLEVKK